MMPYTNNHIIAANNNAPPQFPNNNNNNFIINNNGGVHPKYPCTINNNPGVSCSSSSGGLISRSGQLMGNFGYGTTVTMENKFRGDSCYCAVHYTMFKSAARVSLKIVLLCKGVDVAKVHGRIVVWSDIFNYTRDYDKKYYRRVLYDEPDDQLYYPRKVAPQR